MWLSKSMPFTAATSSHLWLSKACPTAVMLTPRSATSYPAPDPERSTGDSIADAAALSPHTSLWYLARARFIIGMRWHSMNAVRKVTRALGLPAASCSVTVTLFTMAPGSKGKEIAGGADNASAVPLADLCLPPPPPAAPSAPSRWAHRKKSWGTLRFANVCPESSYFWQ